MQVPPGCRMVVHARIHGGTDEDFRPAGQERGGEEIVGHAACQAGHEIGRGRSNQDHIGIPADIDVSHDIFFACTEHAGVDLIAGERGEGQGRNEFPRRSRHHHRDHRLFLGKLTHPPGHLEGSDRAAHPDDDSFSGKNRLCHRAPFYDY